MQANGTIRALERLGSKLHKTPPGPPAPCTRHRVSKSQATLKITLLRSHGVSNPCTIHCSIRCQIYQICQLLQDMDHSNQHYPAKERPCLHKENNIARPRVVFPVEVPRVSKHLNDRLMTTTTTTTTTSEAQTRRVQPYNSYPHSVLRKPNCIVPERRK